MTYRVLFEPWGVEVQCEPGCTILDAARQAEVPIRALCGGRGTCHKCQVRVIADPVPTPTAVELEALSAIAIQGGFRLACLHSVDRDMTVETVPVLSRGKEAAPLLERAFAPAPPVRRHLISLKPPTLDHPVDDVGAVLQAAEGSGVAAPRRVDYQVARRLPATLRSSNWQVQVSIRGDEWINVRPGEACAQDEPDMEPKVLGLAVDLGTTNIAGYLYDLVDGELLGVYGIANPLATYGADIISRLSYSSRAPENGRRMQSVLTKSLGLLIDQILEQQGCRADDLEEIVVVGNSGMHHLFLDLPASQLVLSPYVPALRQEISIKARDLGLRISPGGYVHVPPLVGGFIGSDLLSVALSTRIDQRPGVYLALDIGTNTELLLSVDGELWSCSTASGPALEGAALQFGCMAMEGAVDRVWLEAPGDMLSYHTIKNRPAIGICGSGIIETLAVMYRAGVINATGRLQVDHPLVRESPDGDHTMVLVPADKTDLGVDLTISQSDVRALQLAKGAIRAGADTLLDQHGLQPEDVDEILIAGAFGSHIDVASGLEVGLFPPVPRERVRQIGNAAGLGAGLMLLSVVERREAQELSERISYVELATDPEFIRRFARSQHFPR